MSDFAKDQRQRPRRGSLLDYAGDAPAAREIPADPGPPERASPPSSLLAAPARNARLSTSRFNAGEARASAETPITAERRPARANLAGTDGSGDRMARLIGKVVPDESRADPHPAAHAAAHSRRPPPRDEPTGPAVAPDRQPQPTPYDHDEHYHWHAAAPASWQETGSRPLLDASILISAVWRFRYLIAATTVAGAVIGVMMALATPHKYYAESRLFVDPREIQVTADDIRNQQLSTEAMLAITDSQLQILSSTSVLEKVVVDLGLERDPDFNGSRTPGGIGAGWKLIKEIFTGKSGSSDAAQKALNTLRHALSVSRDSKTFVIIVGIDTRDPAKSALIANSVVETYLDEEGQAQSGLLERTSESIDSRIKSLRSDLDTAEREVERFKAENGIVGIGGQYIDDKVILAVSDQLANARAAKVGIRVKADNLAKVRIDDVLTGAFPEEFLSSNLTDLRRQYTQTKSTADSLATRLGPRHPQYVSAKSSLDTIRSEISAELRRIIASSQTELQRAVETEQELASQMAVAKSRAMDQSVELVTLRELERKATATREIYEAFLKRSRETSERSNMSTRNVRVISPAEAPLKPMGPSRKFIAIGGMLSGLLAGVGVALLVGAVESIRSYNAAAPQFRFQAPPFAGYPAQPHPTPPQPGPPTPPRGPGRRTRQAREGAADAFAAAADAAISPPLPGARAGAGASSRQQAPMPQPAAYSDNPYAMAQSTRSAADRSRVPPQSARQHTPPPSPMPQPSLRPPLGSRETMPPQSADNGAVDRIRQEMDTLRSRIDGYGATRRRG